MVVETRSSTTRRNTIDNVESNIVYRDKSRQDVGQTWEVDMSLKDAINKHQTHKEADSRRLLRRKRGNFSCNWFHMKACRLKKWSKWIYVEPNDHLCNTNVAKPLHTSSSRKPDINAHGPRPVNLTNLHIAPFVGLSTRPTTTMVNLSTVLVVDSLRTIAIQPPSFCSTCLPTKVNIQWRI